MAAEKNALVRLDERTLKRIDALARGARRSRSSMIKLAVEHHQEHVKWLAVEVGKGLDDLEAARVRDFQTLARKLEQKRAAMADQRPRDGD